MEEGSCLGVDKGEGKYLGRERGGGKIFKYIATCESFRLQALLVLLHTS